MKTAHVYSKDYGAVFEVSEEFRHCLNEYYWDEGWNCILFAYWDSLGQPAVMVLEQVPLVGLSA